jgi:ribosomal-protein-alanine N-acetyltransferase
VTFTHTPHLVTQRLFLRDWRAEDLDGFARMNADPRVMAFFPATLSEEESNHLVERIRSHFLEHGFGLWATVDKSTQQFMGFVGLLVPTFEAPFMPCVEIGWRLAPRFWGRGFATEAAREVLEFGFFRAGLSEIVSMTSTSNLRSIGVMKRLGMIRDPMEDFDHPKVPDGHRLKRHVLYRLSADEFLGSP